MLAEGKSCPVTAPDTEGRFWKAELGPVSARAGPAGSGWPAPASAERASGPPVLRMEKGTPKAPSTPTPRRLSSRTAPELSVLMARDSACGTGQLGHARVAGSSSRARLPTRRSRERDAQRSGHGVGLRQQAPRLVTAALPRGDVPGPRSTAHEVCEELLGSLPTSLLQPRASHTALDLLTHTSLPCLGRGMDTCHRENPLP